MISSKIRYSIKNFHEHKKQSNKEELRISSKNSNQCCDKNLGKMRLLKSWIKQPTFRNQ